MILRLWNLIILNFIYFIIMGHKNSKIMPYKNDNEKVSTDKKYYDCIFCDTKIHYFCQKYYRERNLDINFW